MSTDKNKLKEFISSLYELKLIYINNDGLINSNRVNENINDITARSRKASENGKLGGRPPKKAGKGKANDNLNESKTEANDNLNESGSKAINRYIEKDISLQDISLSPEEDNNKTSVSDLEKINGIYFSKSQVTEGKKIKINIQSEEDLKTKIKETKMHDTELSENPTNPAVIRYGVIDGDFMIKESRLKLDCKKHNIDPEKFGEYFNNLYLRNTEIYQNRTFKQMNEIYKKHLIKYKQVKDE